MLLESLGFQTAFLKYLSGPIREDAQKSEWFFTGRTTIIQATPSPRPSWFIFVSGFFVFFFLWWKKNVLSLYPTR